MKTQKQYRYTVFATKWGWFGLLANGNGLLRACLPMEDTDAVKARLLEGIDSASLDKTGFSSIAKQIEAYYEGKPADFSAASVDFSGFTVFQQAILTALRNVRYGSTTTYGQLAQKASSPGAARAVGACMAKNPLPLIVPCHRVLGSDGSMTGFSGFGGIATKTRMLRMENSLFANA